MCNLNITPPPLSCLPTAPVLSYQAQYLTRSQPIIFMYANNELVAKLELIRWDDALGLYAICLGRVEPGHRRNGYYTQLLLHAVTIPGIRSIVSDDRNHLSNGVWARLYGGPLRTDQCVRLTQIEGKPVVERYTLEY